ncbi:hypothetical protein JOQ06_005856, partial [Pogonophryne albipinna]
METHPRKRSYVQEKRAAFPHYDLPLNSFTLADHHHHPTAMKRPNGRRKTKNVGVVSPLLSPMH